MTDLGNRTILTDGTVICEDAALVELLYQGLDLDRVFAMPSTDVLLFNNTVKLFDNDFDQILTATDGQYADVKWFDHWTTPSEYQNIDVADFCYYRCETVEEITRVQYELALFEERNMLPVLRHLIFLVDHFRANNILWGVGRGSSVSSFVLFLIGINRINPLIFDLDVKEFLK